MFGDVFFSCFPKKFQLEKANLVAFEKQSHGCLLKVTKFAS